MSKEKYTFAGWNTQADTLGTSYQSGQTFIMASADVVLYAKWRMNVPFITSQPVNATCPVNGNVIFTVAATGASLSFQWQKNGNNITGATDSTYAPPALTVADSGTSATYRCIVSNTAGITTSNGATLGVATLTDIDGNVYHQVKIGTQVWTMENLRTTKYNDGAAIPYVANAASWASLSTPGYCIYNNATIIDSIRKWGALYNWYVVSPTNPKQITPAGWHVPSDTEWATLQKYLIANGYNWDRTRTDNKIAKAMAARNDSSIYNYPGTIGNDLSNNNSVGFSALPSGYRFYNGGFYVQDTTGYWWSTTMDGATNVWCYNLRFDFEYLGRDNDDRCCGFSIRLIKTN